MGVRKRLLKGFMAAVLAVAVTLPGGARPAQAFDPVVIKQYIDLVNSAYTLIRNVLGSGGSEQALRDAVQLIISAIESSKNQILSHMDALATAEAKACARHHVIEFVDIDRFSTDTLQRWAQDATGCVTLVQSLTDVVGDKAQVDLLGLALNTVGPIAMAARARAGFSVNELVSTLRTGNTTVRDRLAPTCKSVYREGMLEHINCTAYNGDKGQHHSSATIAADLATAGTSRAVAKAALPLLQP